MNIDPKRSINKAVEQLENAEPEVEGHRIRFHATDESVNRDDIMVSDADNMEPVVRYGGAVPEADHGQDDEVEGHIWRGGVMETEPTQDSDDTVRNNTDVDEKASFSPPVSGATSDGGPEVEGHRIRFHATRVPEDDDGEDVIEEQH